MMTRRIAVTPETLKLVSDFAKGLGVTQDEALRFVFGRIMKLGKDDPMIVGRQLVGELKDEGEPQKN